jgi:hypothetical protein
MSFEILFVIFIVGFMIVSRLLKQMAKKTEKGGEKPASGWKKGLQQLFEEIRREMEAEKGTPREEAESSKGRARWWEDLMEPEPGAEEAAAEPEPKKTKVQPRQAEPAAFYRQPSGTARAAGGEISRPTTERGEPAARLSRQNLRQAVIWSEILAKPRGLRDLDP